MTQLLVHPVTKKSLDGFIKSPPHALMLVGQSGSGKTCIAQNLVEEILELDGKIFDDYAYGLHIKPEDSKSIGIDVVRQLEQFLSLKVPSSSSYNRAIIVEDADRLTLEAQNALLKTLEEPPSGTIIVLTATHQQSLLPTITSRVQAVDVQRPKKQDLIKHFSQKFSDSDIDQAYAISAGLPGLMHGLLSQEDHPLMAATETARRLLGQSSYERLIEVEHLAKDKQMSADVTYILQQMAHVSLQKAGGNTARRWQSVLIASHEAASALRSNAQPKLALTSLMLQL